MMSIRKNGAWIRGLALTAALLLSAGCPSAGAGYLARGDTGVSEHERSMRGRAVLGYLVTCGDSEDDCVLHRVAEPDGTPLEEPQKVFSGTLDANQEALISHLLREHGEGNANLPVWSMGGRQFWADVYYYSGWRIQENVLTDHYRLLDHEDRRLAWGTYEACRTRFEIERAEGAIAAPEPHWVILIHGIFRSKEAMGKLAAALRAEGYEPVGVNYASTRQSVDDHARQIERLLQSAEGVEQVSFVAHSMGGLVTRRLLARDGEWRERIPVHRVVMLATPNQGSVIAETLAEFLPFQMLTGPSGHDLAPVMADALPPPDVPFAVIAGAKGDGRGFNPLLPGDDDGVVRLEATKLEGMQGHFTVSVLHSAILANPKAIAATLRFLRGAPLAPEEAN